MILDMRTYTCKPGMIKAHIEIYKKYGQEAQARCLGKPVVWATTEVGDVNSFVHIWAYKDVADREKKRAAMWQDAGWLDYVKKSGELGARVGAQETGLGQLLFPKATTAPANKTTMTNFERKYGITMAQAQGMSTAQLQAIIKAG